MFVPRMWLDEIERIGKQKCTPFGYALQGVSDLIGFVGLLLLLATPIYLAYRGIAGSFHWSLLWLLLVPVGVGILGTVIEGISWQLARKKQFKYDYESRESTWYGSGEKRSYSYADWVEANRRAE